MILDGTIVDADINASAAIAQSKISGLSASLGLKADLASPTFTGTVAGITKSMVGLGNVDNTSDANKPVSTATQTALDAKLALAGGTMTGTLVLSGAPTSNLHAATKAYVDAAVNNINVHEAAVAATTGNVNLTNAVDNNKTLDGVTIKTGDRILVKNQSTAEDNGIYIVASNGAPTRATDYDAAGEVSSGDFIFVKGGTVNANTGWIQTADVTTVGTDSLSFTQFSGAGTYTANNGLSLSGTAFSINTAITADLSTAQTLTNKTFVAPILGSATATSINGTTIPSSKTLVTTTDTGTVTSTMIADGTIVNGDISSSAAIAYSKLNLASSITSSDIVDGTIVDGDINASAAIAQSKISGLTTALSAKAPLAAPTFTGTVTVSSSGIAFSDSSVQTVAGVPSVTPLDNSTFATGTVNLATGLKDYMVKVGASVTITLQQDSAATYPIGTSIDFWANGTGAQFAAGTGVTIVNTPGLKFRAVGSVATAMKVAANTWLVFGDLSA
ncbi:hypothetical protein UFOVP204_1 [uncultured Caudovirales phage]|uniref:Tail fiber protein n=1 Tax=uncultured Caudovirales phage TaxID=2100421 RepID=A0A6J7WJ45_9CAUD|nr:hypothetical protein UFOVP204_1 [uncultured Caudovirales phage]